MNFVSLSANQAEVCFSNANFRSIYLNGSLGSSNRSQSPKNLCGLGRLSLEGVDPCLSLGDISQSQRLIRWHFAECEKIQSLASAENLAAAPPETYLWDTFLPRAASVVEKTGDLCRFWGGEGQHEKPDVISVAELHFQVT